MSNINRRQMLASSIGAAGLIATNHGVSIAQPQRNKAQIAITLDLEMSRHYPKRGMTEWDYQKGNLDEATKAYSVKAGRRVKKLGGKIHYFCVGRVLEQPNIDWLLELNEEGHPIGNHTYDHVNVMATTAKDAQFRFQRSPWLVDGKSALEVIRENIRICNHALEQRAKVKVNGFRTPGGFYDGLKDRPQVQELLLDLGFTWASSRYPKHESGEPRKPPTDAVYKSIVNAQANAQPFVYPSGLIEIPMSPISDVTAFRSKFWKLEYFLHATELAVKWAIENKGVFDFLAHPSCLVVEDPDCKIVELICRLTKEAGDRAELVTLDQIAAQMKPRP